MTDKWNLGPPPHVGWWKASIKKSESLWRWWDGKHWSMTAYDTEDAHEVVLWAGTVSGYEVSEVFWCHDWPENARVPRYVPEGATTRAPTALVE